MPPTHITLAYGVCMQVVTIMWNIEQCWLKWLHFCHVHLDHHHPDPTDFSPPQQYLRELWLGTDEDGELVGGCVCWCYIAEWADVPYFFCYCPSGIFNFFRNYEKVIKIISPVMNYEWLDVLFAKLPTFIHKNMGERVMWGCVCRVWIVGVVAF